MWMVLTSTKSLTTEEISFFTEELTACFFDVRWNCPQSWGPSLLPKACARPDLTLPAVPLPAWPGGVSQHPGSQMREGCADPRAARCVAGSNSLVREPNL